MNLEEREGMRVQTSGKKERASLKIGVSLLLVAVIGLLAGTLGAQQKGPLPPPARTDSAAATPVAATKTNTGTQDRSSHLTNEPPAIPVEQIIRRFTENEADFRKEREKYTYTQVFLFQTIDDDGQPDGEYRLTSDMTFNSSGKRNERVIEAPASTIQRIEMEQQDFDDIEKVWPLVLTPEELPKYDVKYVGREQVDELGTYVFDIAPIKMEKGQRYFQGRIWVEDRDMQIVKTRGKGTGLIKKKQDSAFPIFETFRENIEGHYWFPTYTRSDDTLHFKTSDVRVHVAVRYQNYKRFGSTVKIGKATQVDPEKPEKPEKP
jgi:hypothetical protein